MKAMVAVAMGALVSVSAFGEVESTRGYFTAADGTVISYLTAGEGTPVVLIHGYTGSAEGNWFSNGVAAALAKDHFVVAIDCRGHGLSDKPHEGARYGAWMWQDVVQLMNHLEIEKAHVHGYSMGGGIVTQLLAHYPNRLITASYGGSGIREVDPEWIEKLPPDKEGTDPQEAEARSTLRSSPTRDEAALAAVREAPPWQGVEASQMDLSKITIPILAINGEFDRPIARTQRMKRELPDFESVVLPGKSHLTAIMAGYIPQKYIASLVAFIGEHDPAG